MGGPGSQKCCSRLSGGGAALENFLETPAAVHLATVVCVVQKSHQGAGERPSWGLLRPSVCPASHVRVDSFSRCRWLACSSSSLVQAAAAVGNTVCPVLC